MTTAAVLRQRSILGTIALALAVISALGVIGLLVGHVIDPNHFSNDSKKEGFLDNVFFYMFAPGLILAALVGIAAWLFGRRTNRAGDALAGKVTLGYVVVGIIVAVVISNVG